MYLIAGLKLSVPNVVINDIHHVGPQELVKKYSEFINFPIYLWSTKETEKEVPVDELDEVEDEEEKEESMLS
jgi:HSP90 family molecular chaperone